MMNKNFWIVLFAIILFANVAGILLSNEIIQFISKPLIVISLAGYFIVATNAAGSNLKVWILSALAFSWIGDALLMFQGDDPLFFLLGLSAFLLAHVFYILFFHVIRVQEKITGKWWLLLIVVVYYAVLISILSPHLGTMKLPVRIYGIVISFMFMLAMHMLFLKNKKTGVLMMSGALLFVISDSVLAINKFYHSFEAAGAVIMLTYGVAQLFITTGAVKYITSKHKE